MQSNLSIAKLAIFTDHPGLSTAESAKPAFKKWTTIAHSFLTASAAETIRSSLTLSRFCV
jgi:hypothetical protein